MVNFILCIFYHKKKKKMNQGPKYKTKIVRRKHWSEIFVTMS